MKKLIGIVCIFFLCASCEEEPILMDPQSTMSLKLWKLNADDDQLYEIAASQELNKNSGWIQAPEEAGKVEITKSILLQAVSNNGEEYQFGLEVRKTEDKATLILEDEELNYWERNWDYPSTEAEISKLWNNSNTSLLITINHTYLHLTAADVRLEQARKALVDGEEKTFVKLRFSGEAFGWYDPEHEHLGYRIEEGVFEGIIE